MKLDIPQAGYLRQLVTNQGGMPSYIGQVGAINYYFKRSWRSKAHHIRNHVAGFKPKGYELGTFDGFVTGYSPGFNNLCHPFPHFTRENFAHFFAKFIQGNIRPLPKSQTEYPVIRAAHEQDHVVQAIGRGNLTGKPNTDVDLVCSSFSFNNFQNLLAHHPGDFKIGARGWAVTKDKLARINLGKQFGTKPGAQKKKRYRNRSKIRRYNYPAQRNNFLYQPLININNIIKKSLLHGRLVIRFQQPYSHHRNKGAG